MNYELTANLILKKIQSGRIDYGPFEDLWQIMLNCNDKDLAHRINVALRKEIGRAMKSAGEFAGKFYDLYRRSLLFDAPNYLDSYLLYIEIDRPLEERFYQTRRNTLKPIVDALQTLADDELDELFVAQPPRTGKTSLMAFAMTWLMGKYPGKPNLYSSYSDTITRSFYNAVYEILTDKETYLFTDVFPQRAKIKTNAADETIDIGRKKHYPSLTCRSIDGTLNGACDVDGGFAIGDDFVSGYEEALSKDRMIKLWGKVSNNYISRGKATTKFIWVGTRWSNLDPEGMRLDLLENGSENKSRRFKVINLPALDEKDQSNFDYPFKKGFSTAAYKQIRENFERNNDMASWLAQYMGEPIEREGTLFTPDDFRYYNGELPPGQPDRVFMAVDPAYGGGDFVASPVCMQYGDLIYVPGVVYNNGDKSVTQPIIASVAKKYGVSAIQVEVNKSTEPYKEGIGDELKKIGHKVTLFSKNSSSPIAKTQKIFEKAPDIREHFVFLDSGMRDREYAKFMENVFSFKINLSDNQKKKQHDDAPDSLAQACDYLFAKSIKFTIFNRPF